MSVYWILFAKNIHKYILYIVHEYEFENLIEFLFIFSSFFITEDKNAKLRVNIEMLILKFTKCFINQEIHVNF